MRKLAIVCLCIAMACIVGCETCDRCVDCCYDDQPPAVPTGVHSITGDGYVVVVWNPVYEDDLAGYGVYRSRSEPGPYHRIGDVGRYEETVFWDEHLMNGVTYYYAVDAYDYSGNESDLSYETVDDTPRPEGWDLTWYTREARPGESAIAILPEAYDAIVILPYDDFEAQYYLTRGGSGVMRIVPLRANLIQDYGYTYSEDDVDEAPTDGWSVSPDGVEVIPGHTYILRTVRGFYGKVRVETLSANWIVVYWAFQGQRWSTELAPPRRGSRLQRG
jgi:hypothetical protein